MKRAHLLPCLLLFVCGCVDAESPTKQVVSRKTEPAAKKAPVGKNIFLEIDGEQRRVLVQAYVCLRQGTLEQFLTRKRTKEHEAVLAADIDAREVHAALVLARAEPGHPVRFQPK